MEIEQVEKELRSAIEAQLAKGERLAQSTWGVIVMAGKFVKKSKECGMCALSCWALNSGVAPTEDGASLSVVDVAMNHFGWSIPDTASFVRGFDGSWEIGDDGVRETFRLGRRLARDYVK